MTELELHRYQELFEDMLLAVILLDDNGICIEANAAAAELLGFEYRSEVEFDLVNSGLFNEQDQLRMAELISTNNAFHGFEANMTTDMGIRRIRVNGHRVLDPVRGANANWVVIEDITEVAASALTIAEMNARLADSNRQLDQFASMAAHDLKAPARRVRSFSELLLREEGLSETAQGFIDRIRISGRQMEDIIEGLLEFARVGSENAILEPVDLLEVIERSCEHSRTDSNAADFQIVVGDGFPVVIGNPMALEQLCHNLIGNAIKFRNRDGSGELRIESHPDEATSGGTVLSFTDNGVGFPGEEAERIFDMLHQAHGKSEFGGHGIGLAICRRICRIHGWSITAHSGPECGAEFQILIPGIDLNALAPADEVANWVTRAILDPAKVT